MCGAHRNERPVSTLGIAKFQPPSLRDSGEISRNFYLFATSLPGNFRRSYHEDCCRPLALGPSTSLDFIALPSLTCVADARGSSPPPPPAFPAVRTAQFENKFYFSGATGAAEIFLCSERATISLSQEHAGFPSGNFENVPPRNT